MAHKKIFFSGNPCIVKDYAGQTGRWDARFTFADEQGNYADANNVRSVDFVVDADEQGLLYDVSDFFHYSRFFNRDAPKYAFGVPYKITGAVLKAKVRSDAQVGIAPVRNSEEIYSLRGLYENDNQDFFEKQSTYKRFLSNKGNNRRQGFYETDFLWWIHSDDAIASEIPKMKVVCSYSDRADGIAYVPFSGASKLYDVWALTFSFFNLQITGLVSNLPTLTSVAVSVVSNSESVVYSETVRYYCTDLADADIRNAQMKFRVMYENSFGRYEPAFFEDFEVQANRNSSEAMIGRETRSLQNEISRKYVVQTGPSNEQMKAVLGEISMSENIFRIQPDGSYIRVYLTTNEFDYSTLASQKLEFVESKQNYGRNK